MPLSWKRFINTQGKMISLVIPLYNKEASIAQSLKSVLSQEYDDLRL